MSQELLKNIYLFKELSADSLKLVSEVARLETWNRSDVIFSQGDPATALYVIKFGSVRIHQQSGTGDNIEVAVLGTGSHFGEMSFIDREHRSATVEVLEKSEIFSIDYEKLAGVLAKNPLIGIQFYKSLSHFLCGRLRVTTNDLSFSRELNLKHF
jgi:CRP-like cAMP-binding protein